MYLWQLLIIGKYLLLIIIDYYNCLYIFMWLVVLYVDFFFCMLIIFISICFCNLVRIHGTWIKNEWCAWWCELTPHVSRARLNVSIVICLFGGRATCCRWSNLLLCYLYWMLKYITVVFVIWKYASSPVITVIFWDI
jgi:hypothetical protein